MMKEISENTEAENRSKGPVFSSMAEYHQPYNNAILLQEQSWA